MSSYNLNTTLKSCVREQAYLPFKLPLRGWVCNAGSKGFWESFESKFSYAFWSNGFFLSNFLERLLKLFSSSSLIAVIIRGV